MDILAVPNGAFNHLYHPALPPHGRREADVCCQFGTLRCSAPSAVILSACDPPWDARSGRKCSDLDDIDQLSLNGRSLLIYVVRFLFAFSIATRPLTRAFLNFLTLSSCLGEIPTATPRRYILTFTKLFSVTCAATVNSPISPGGYYSPPRISFNDPLHARWHLFRHCKLLGDTTSGVIKPMATAPPGACLRFLPEHCAVIASAVSRRLSLPTARVSLCLRPDMSSRLLQCHAVFD